MYIISKPFHYFYIAGGNFQLCNVQTNFNHCTAEQGTLSNYFLKEKKQSVNLVKIITTIKIVFMNAKA